MFLLQKLDHSDLDRFHILHRSLKYFDSKHSLDYNCMCWVHLDQLLLNLLLASNSMCMFGFLLSTPFFLRNCIC